MEREIPVAQPMQINTDGGPAIRGSVHVQQGDFVGRDKILNTVNNFIQQAISAVEEAEKARASADQRLAEGVRDYARQLAVVVAGGVAAGDLYRGLASYRLHDVQLFFGRDQAIVELLEHLHRGRVTLLHSASGAGKSSLLHAGIAPRLLAAGHLPIILRPTGPPSLKIKQEFLPELTQTAPPTSLREFLRKVTAVLGQSVTLYVLLDQFEEFFTLLTKEVQTSFVNELADCVEDESLNVGWVLAVRSEYFGELANFRPRIRNPFENDYRLNCLTPTEARLVITEPAAKRAISFEPDLVEQLLADLTDQDQEIAPPQLQLVCTALYDVLLNRGNDNPALPRQITRQMYLEEGCASGILREHLNRVLHRNLRTKQERDLARRLLIELVSSEPRRIRRTRSALAKILASSALAAENLSEVLDQLVENRLLTVEKDEETDDPCYELVHDYLLTEIKVDPAMQAQKAAQEMLAREVADFRRSGDKFLLSLDKFTFINSERGSLVLDPIAEKLLHLSATQHATTRRRFLIMAWSLVAFVVVVSIIGGLYRAANSARQQAQAARNTAQALRIAAASLNERSVSPQRGLLLALEASKFLDPSTQKPDPEAMRALYAQFDQWRYWQNTLVAHTKSVRAVRFGRTDDQLFSVALEGRALEWDIGGKAGQPKTLVALDQAIDAIAVHPTQNWIGVGTQRGAIHAISLQAGFPEIRTWQAYAENVRVLTLLFSADGKLLISGGADGVIKLWSADSLSQNVRAEITIPDQDQCVPTGQCWVRALAISPDGQWLAASAQNHRLYVWHLTPNQPPVLILNVHFLANVWAVAISHDSAWLAAGDETEVVYIYKTGDIHKGNPEAQPPYQLLRLSPISDVRALAFSPVENLLAIGDRSGIIGTVRIGEHTGSLQVLGRLDDVINTVAFSPSGNYVATGGEDHSVRIWHTEPLNQEPQVLSGHTGRVRALAFYPAPLTAGQPPGSSTLISAGEDETIRLWAPDNATKPLQVITETGNQILAAAVSLDGHWLATGGRDGRVRLHNLQDARAAPVVLGEHTGEVVAVAFSPDGHVLATGAADQRIYLWPVDNPTQAPQGLDNAQGGILALAFSGDGKFLAAGDEARRVKLWDLNQSPPTPRLMYTHKDWVWAVTFSPDGRYLASASADSMLRLTPLHADVAAQGPVFAHAQRARALVYDPTGTLLASAGDDYTVKLWNPQNLDEQPVELHQHNGIVRTLAFSPDGAHLASAGDDNEIRLWTVRLPDLQRMACARTARNLSADEWQRFLPGQAYRATCPDLEK